MRGLPVTARVLREYLALFLWSLALFAGCYSLNTRHNNFPYYCHPDEPGKVEQVLTGDWNFHHPMLLLAATRLAVDVTGAPHNEQSIVEVGRRVSAAFIAAAVVAFSLLAYLWRGWLPAVTAGFTLTLHHQLFELAHYMKEDSALLMGLAFAFLAALAYAQSPSAWRAVVLGASCGLAISGKYVGFSALIVALPVVWHCSEAERGRRLGWFGGALVGMIVAVNLPLLLHPGLFEHSFNREMQLVISGQGDVTRRVPHLLYWNVFVDNSTPLIWLFSIAFLVFSWQRRSQLNLAQILIALFPFTFAVALSFSPKENDRYFLPVSALFTLLASLGVWDAPRLVLHFFQFFGLPHPERAMSGRWRWEALAVGSAALVVTQLSGWFFTKPGWLAYDAAFERDDGAELVAWMKQNLPANVKVAADARTGLTDVTKKKYEGKLPAVPQAVTVSRLASDLGSLQTLRDQGYAYVAVSESSYGRFFRSDLRAKDDKDQKYRAGRAFYEELLRGEPLFDRERGTVIYLHPGIRVYKIPEA